MGRQYENEKEEKKKKFERVPVVFYYANSY